MARSNREVALAFHDAYNEIDVRRIQELLHPEVEIRGHDGRLSQGPDEAVASMLGWRREWESFRGRLEEFVDLGDDRALLKVHSTGVGRGSGIEIEMHGSEIWSFSGGLVAGIVLYRTREEPLAAAGLE